MLRNSFIAFLSGWMIWFWIDKPENGLQQFLKADDSMLVNFQRAFDLLKSGYLAQSYIYIWNAHYIVLAIIFGAMLSFFLDFTSEYLRRKRLKSVLLPSQAVKKSQKKEYPIEKTENSE